MLAVNRQIAVALLFASASASAIQTTQHPPEGPKPQPSSAYRANPDENGVYHKGDGVKPPTLLYSVEPEFSEEARKRKIAGDVIVEVVVDMDGNTRDVYAIKSSGLPNSNKKDLAAIHSLESKAIDAVRQYRFKPATANGKPVPYRMEITVSFQIF